MATTMLPEELIEEIFLRVRPDEAEHLVSPALVCKAWRCILSDQGFLHRYRRFHGTPPLLGFIWNNHYYNDQTTFEFVPRTGTAASTISMPTLDFDGRTHLALDCRHGRVLIQSKVRSRLADMLVVWDPVTGNQQQLRVPTYLHSSYNYAGAVLCAMDGCDHLNCHGGPFLIVLVGMSNRNNRSVHKWASMYSSETSAWGALTSNDITNQHIETRPSLLIGNTLYFPTRIPGYSILKYDFCKHELSVMYLPGQLDPILIKIDGRGLGCAALIENSIHMWSRQVNIKGVGQWVKYMAMELEDTLLPNGGQLRRKLICMAEGTNTVFIAIEYTGIFMLDLKSKQVMKLVKRISNLNGRIIPFRSFYTPKY